MIRVVLVALSATALGGCGASTVYVTSPARTITVHARTSTTVPPARTKSKAVRESAAGASEAKRGHLEAEAHPSPVELEGQDNDRAYYEAERAREREQHESEAIEAGLATRLREEAREAERKDAPEGSPGVGTPAPAAGGVPGVDSE